MMTNNATPVLASFLLPAPLKVNAATLIVAAPSKFAQLFDLLYSLIIDYIETGDGKTGERDTLQHIRTVAPDVYKKYRKQLPGLKDAVHAAIAGSEKTSALYELGVEIKNAFPQFRQEAFGMSHADLEVLNDIGRYLRTDAESALVKLKKFAAITGSPFVTGKFTPKTEGQGSARKKLEKLLGVLVGRKDVTLTADEATVIKDTKPEVYKEYLALRKEFNQAWRDFLVAFIRQSGRHTVPYVEVLKAMDANGLQHLMPRGFTGQIDDRGRLYTKDGHDMLNGAPSAVTFPSMRMNPHFGQANGGDWVTQAIRADGSDGPYYYTETFVKQQAKQKFEKVATLSEKMDGIRARWIQELRQFNEMNVNSVMAAILECLYEFSARVGGAKNSTGGSSTYGISTLLVKHARIDASGNIILRYNGKAGVLTKHVIMKQAPTPQGKMLYKAVVQLLQNKLPKEPIFTVTLKNGARKIIPGARINQHFRALGAGDVGVHKIRTYHGTKLFQEQVDALIAAGKKPKNEAQMLEWINKMATVVGKKLNHMKTTSVGTKVTGTTALAAYIDPSLVVSVCRGWGYRPPKFLERFDVV